MPSSTIRTPTLKIRKKLQKLSDSARLFSANILLFQLVYYGLHFIRIEAFTRITVKCNIKLIVDNLHVVERKLFKPLEEHINKICILNRFSRFWSLWARSGRRIWFTSPTVWFRYTVRFQIYYTCPLALFQNILLFQLVYYGLHFIRIEAFTPAKARRFASIILR